MCWKVNCGATLLTLVIASSASAVLTTIGSRGVFNATYPSAVLENFEEARVLNGSTGLMTGPLNSLTNNSIFLPGEIVNGLNIIVPGANNLFVSSNGFDNYTSHAISFDSPSTTQPQITTELTNGNVRAVAFDLTSNPSGNNVTVQLFNGAASLGLFVINNVQGSGTFFGASSNSDVITKITLSNGSYFGIDNIAFAVPEPTTLGLLVLFVLVVSIVGRQRPASMR